MSAKANSRAHFLESTIYRPGLWFRDAESAEIMITVSVRGDSLPMSCSATCKESWISLVTYESKCDVMWLAADVSMEREHGDLPLCIDNTHVQRVTLSVVQTMTFLVSGGLPRNSERWYRLLGRIMSEWALRYHSHTFIVVEALSRSELAQTRSELLQLPAERLILVHTCLTMTVIRRPACN
jgi:hypothetical protein